MDHMKHVYYEIFQQEIMWGLYAVTILVGINDS